MTVKQHVAKLGVSHVEISVDEQEYCIVYGTGERHYGSGLGVLAFAYEADDHSECNIDTYQDFCDTFTPIEDVGLAQQLAVQGFRLTRAGSCAPVLTDQEFIECQE